MNCKPALSAAGPKAFGEDESTADRIKKIQKAKTYEEVDDIEVLKIKNLLKNLMKNIYMNHYVNIMNSFEEKGKEDIPTDEELLLFSESEDEEVKPKKQQQYLKINI